MSNYRRKSSLFAVVSRFQRAALCVVLALALCACMTVTAFADSDVMTPEIPIWDSPDTAALRTNFITRLYRNFLLREPEPEGLKSWEDAVRDGRATGAKLVAGFVHSQEFQNQPLDNTQYVTAFYKVILGREPDAAGLNAWVSVLNNGYSKDKVLEGFLNSPEMAALCAKMEIQPGTFKSTDIIDTNHKITEFVMRLYENCLGRRYDEGGLRNWVNALATRSINGFSAAMGFFVSEEFYSKDIDDAEFVTICYRTILGREPDAGGLRNWIDFINRDPGDPSIFDHFREEVVLGFCGSQEFANKCAVSGISPFGSHVDTELIGYVRSNPLAFKKNFGWMASYNYNGENGEGYTDFRLEVYSVNAGSGSIDIISLIAPSQYTIGGVSYGMSYSEATRILRGKYEFLGVEDGIDYYVTDNDILILVEPENGVVGGILATVVFQ